jgi:hypothetical protein
LAANFVELFLDFPPSVVARTALSQADLFLDGVLHTATRRKRERMSERSENEGGWIGGQATTMGGGKEGKHRKIERGILMVTSGV